jgi:hypothetical protein
MQASRHTPFPPSPRVHLLIAYRPHSRLGNKLLLSLSLTPSGVQTIRAGDVEECHSSPPAPRRVIHVGGGENAPWRPFPNGSFVPATSMQSPPSHELLYPLYQSSPPPPPPPVSCLVAGFCQEQAFGASPPRWHVTQLTVCSLFPFLLGYPGIPLRLEIPSWSSFQAEIGRCHIRPVLLIKI